MEELLPLLIFLAGVCSSWLGSQAGGGGGLFFLPALTLLGLPVHLALVTHRCATLCGSLAAFLRFSKTDLIQWRSVMPLLILKVSSGIIGAHIFLETNDYWMRLIVVTSFIVILFLTIYKKAGIKDIQVSKKHELLGYLSYFAVGVWGAIMSAGTGLIKMYTLIYGFGWGYLKANATDKLPSLFGSLAIVLVFAFNGVVDWVYGLAGGIGYGLGAYFGAQYAILKGNTWVRKIMIILILVSIGKLIFF